MEDALKKIASKEGSGSSYHLEDSDSEPDFGIDDEGEYDWLDEEDDVDNPLLPAKNNTKGASQLPQTCYELPPGDDPTSPAPLPQSCYELPPGNDESNAPVQQKEKKNVKKNSKAAAKKKVRNASKKTAKKTLKKKAEKVVKKQVVPKTTIKKKSLRKKNENVNVNALARNTKRTRQTPGWMKDYK